MFFKIHHRSIIGFIMLLGLAFIFTSCGDNNELTSDVIVYENDFESRDMSNITGGITTRRVGSRTIGNYNNDGFTLRLNDLPRHNYIYISFRLFLWDTWDGNTNGLEPDQADKWFMRINDGLTPTSLDTYTGFETTFSNGPCDSQLCLLQAYPNEFPFANNPRTGVRRRVFGFCSRRGQREASSEYFIERTFRHEDAAIIFSFFDELYQPNVADEKCDESWSMDNITVRAITIN